jgi:hypothetical protein
MNKQFHRQHPQLIMVIDPFHSPPIWLQFIEVFCFIVHILEFLGLCKEIEITYIQNLVV